MWTVNFLEARKKREQTNAPDAQSPHVSEMWCAPGNAGILDLSVEGGGLTDAVEAAAYYVCAEAVTNAVKHARASQAWIRIVHATGALTVEVRDDGIGGACVECEGEASGLGGLKDRVEALSGRLEVVSPEGRGTTLRAVFPV